MTRSWSIKRIAAYAVATLVALFLAKISGPAWEAVIAFTILISAIVATAVSRPRYAIGSAIGLSLAIDVLGAYFNGPSLLFSLRPGGLNFFNSTTSLGQPFVWFLKAAHDACLVATVSALVYGATTVLRRRTIIARARRAPPPPDSIEALAVDQSRIGYPTSKIAESISSFGIDPSAVRAAFDNPNTKLRIEQTQVALLSGSNFAFSMGALGLLLWVWSIAAGFSPGVMLIFLIGVILSGFALRSRRKLDI